MLFPSTVFIFAFLPTVLFGYYILFRKSRKLQNIFLTICSLFFYAWGEPYFVFVMMLSIVANWSFALWIDKARGNKQQSTLAIVLMLATNLGILFIFKYLMFVMQNLNSLPGISMAVPNIILPIGISFFTFQAISYVIDVYRGNGEVQRNILNVAIYISFFPQLVAGPIIRYNTIADQIMNRKESFDKFAEGVCRFIVGLGKKVIIANNLAIVADTAFAASESSMVFAWLGAIAYALQIYFDFSGYSDMAIGLGRMFGFHFPENFNHPYISRSISEFWRRWHISLGAWFRDYVYFPLGGSKVNSKKRVVFNLLVVWFLTGFWHGANWTFIVWGLMYFVLIAFEKTTGFNKKLGWFGHVYTMFFVIIGWVFFRAADISSAITYLGVMFGVGASNFVDTIAITCLKNNIYFFLFGIIFAFPVAEWFNNKLNHYKFIINKVFPVIYPMVLLIISIVSIAYIVKAAYNPFIYFNF